MKGSRVYMVGACSDLLLSLKMQSGTVNVSWRTGLLVNEIFTRKGTYSLAVVTVIMQVCQT